jgi:hypothetical protein
MHELSLAPYIEYNEMLIERHGCMKPCLLLVEFTTLFQLVIHFDPGSCLHGRCI